MSSTGPDRYGQPNDGRPGDGRDETPLERWDRNFGELLQELRVAQTGVQILFGFLLSLPFAARFAEIGPLERTLYLITLFATTGAAALLIAPVSYHRMVFRQGRKPQMVAAANRMATFGLFFLLIAVASAVCLVTDVVLNPTAGAVAGGVVAVAYAILWYAIPLRQRRRKIGDPE